VTVSQQGVGFAHRSCTYAVCDCDVCSTSSRVHAMRTEVGGAHDAKGSVLAVKGWTDRAPQYSLTPLYIVGVVLASFLCIHVRGLVV
jgi:hypothetical protein